MKFKAGLATIFVAGLAAACAGKGEMTESADLQTGGDTETHAKESSIEQDKASEVGHAESNDVDATAEVAPEAPAPAPAVEPAPAPEVDDSAAVAPTSGCGKQVLDKSVDAVGEPCMTTADFIASLNLNERQLARARAFGLSDEAVAH